MDSQSIPLSRKSTPFKKVALLEDLGYDGTLLLSSVPCPLMTRDFWPFFCMCGISLFLFAAHSCLIPRLFTHLAAHYNCCTSKKGYAGEQAPPTTPQCFVKLAHFSPRVFFWHWHPDTMACVCSHPSAWSVIQRGTYFMLTYLQLYLH